MTDDKRCGSARGCGGKLAEEYESSVEPHLTASSEKKLRTRLQKLSEEEWAMFYLWRLLQGRIDWRRAELVRRGGVTLLPEGLALVFLGEGSHGGGAS
jgi:hypothetical protein